MTQEEFTARVSENRKKLIYIARTMLPERDCEDAYQSAVLSAWEHLPQLRDASKFDAWIKQILINRCRQMQRQRKKDTDTASALALQDAFPQAELPLQEALDALDESERRLLLLHHEQGYSLHELSNQTGQSESVLKMRLYRTRRRLRIILISLLLILLLASVGVTTGTLDVRWFLENRRAQPETIPGAAQRAPCEIVYDGTLLSAVVSDAVWNSENLSLSLVYSLAGTQEDVHTIHEGHIGVDGERFDHIWADGNILPVSEWAGGIPVFTFHLGEWSIGGQYPVWSEDYLEDGKGETFMTELRLDMLTPEIYDALLDKSGMLSLTCTVHVEDYAYDTILEQGTLTIRVQSPSSEDWRNAYETYFR